MATRLQYRTNLKHKLLALEDGGYGDFDYEDADYDLFLALAVAKLYPAVYTKVKQANLALTAYGTQSLYSITPTYPDRVFLIEDTVERAPVLGWKLSGTDIVNIDASEGAGWTTISTVNAYYYDAYSLPADDVTDAGIAAVYEPLINLGALIEALEARQDTGVRGEPPPTGQFQEVQLLDRLTPRYDKLKEQLAMALPAWVR